MNISTTTWEDDLKCDNCLETCRTLQKASFKNCKCNGYRYCSFPECAKAGLSNHKKVCAMGPASRRLVQWECRLIDGPDSSRHRHYHPYFSDEWDRIILASGGLWLRHLPREAVFNVLIDSFRLRQQDEFVLGQEGTDPLQERFQLYLNLMETREGMTPSW
ncbi:hypothetical protein BDV97DRAFT_177142 [Delphinella strobiligena]|nr:hypothetical protein BDV97DRAFT_177142 [Delphinella strobiligena]